MHGYPVGIGQWDDRWFAPPRHDGADTIQRGSQRNHHSIFCAGVRRGDNCLRAASQWV